MHLRLVTSEIILVKIAIHSSENKLTVLLFRKLLFEKISIFVVWLGRFAPFAK